MTNPSHIPKKDIEKHTIDLILAYEKESGGPIRPPVPVFDIIEYLGYDTVSYTHLTLPTKA